jgi:dihydrodipicolinate synthase/N-acetylneuraminate lyase
VPVAMGAQTTSTLELRRLAKAAARLGAEYIQVSCPFYFQHTEDDFYEYVCEAAAAADVGIILYNTFWTSAGVSSRLVERLMEVPNFVGLKWACPRTDAMEFEDVVSTFADRLTVIDNHLMFALSGMLRVTAFEVHLANYWPEWGVRLIDNVAAARWQEVQLMLVREAMPFYKLWVEIEKTYTSGDGYLDKLCMELVGLDSSRCRPPTRDVRQMYRERCRRMLLATGVPGVMEA